MAQLPLQPPLCRTALAVTVFCPTSAPPALRAASAETRQGLTAVMVQTKAVQGSGLSEAGLYTALWCVLHLVSKEQSSGKEKLG